MLHSLADILKKVTRGEAVYHTCHQTDPRSDSRTGHAHQGDIQHCAGFLMMLRKSGIPPLGALSYGFVPELEDDDSDVYKLGEIPEAYLDAIRMGIMG